MATNSAVTIPVDVTLKPQAGKLGNIWSGSVLSRLDFLGLDGVGVAFPNDSVFELPEGCTCNSVQANIVDNVWLGTAPPVAVEGRVLTVCGGSSAGVPGATIELTRNGTLVGTQSTTGAGAYQFPRVRKGSGYRLQVIAPAGYACVGSSCTSADFDLQANLITDFTVVETTPPRSRACRRRRNTNARHRCRWRSRRRCRPPTTAEPPA